MKVSLLIDPEYATSETIGAVHPKRVNARFRERAPYFDGLTILKAKHETAFFRLIGAGHDKNGSRLTYYQSDEDQEYAVSEGLSLGSSSHRDHTILEAVEILQDDFLTTTKDHPAFPSHLLIPERFYKKNNSGTRIRLTLCLEDALPIPNKLTSYEDIFHLRTQYEEERAEFWQSIHKIACEDTHLSNLINGRMTSNAINAGITNYLRRAEEGWGKRFLGSLRVSYEVTGPKAMALLASGLGVASITDVGSYVGASVALGLGGLKAEVSIFDGRQYRKESENRPLTYALTVKRGY